MAPCASCCGRDRAPGASRQKSFVQLMTVTDSHRTFLTRVAPGRRRFPGRSIPKRLCNQRLCNLSPGLRYGSKFSYGFSYGHFLIWPRRLIQVLSRW